MRLVVNSDIITIKSCYKTVAMKERMPDLNKWVLIDTPYCKYPGVVARWNGAKWVTSDDSEVVNTSFWQEIIF